MTMCENEFIFLGFRDRYMIDGVKALHVQCAANTNPHATP